MKTATLFFSALLLAGSLTAVTAAYAQDGVGTRDDLTAGSYCHIKFPAMQARSLAAEDPTIKSESSGDIVDFYGVCSEQPASEDQVHQQLQDYQRRWASEYED
jgi:hypothetical protein